MAATRKKPRRSGPGRPASLETPLARWVDASGRPRKDLAEELDISVPYLNALCRDEKTPNPALVERISRLTGGVVTNAYWAARTQARNAGTRKRASKTKRKR